MSGLLLLLLAAAAAAWGAWASLTCRPPLVPAVIAAVLFAAGGVVAVLAGWIGGDGIVLPGLQLSPGLVLYYLSEAAWGLVPSVGRALLIVVPVAHLLLVAARRDRAAVLRPLPATLLFAWLFTTIGGEGRPSPEQARGPEKVAYLTVKPRDGGARLIIATGDPFDVFLEVLHVHDTQSPPPRLHLHWTNDGRGLVVRVHEEDYPSFAVDLEGNVTGLLPIEAREWPSDYVPHDVGTRFSAARKDVSKFIHAHGGLAPP